MARLEGARPRIVGRRLTRPAWANGRTLVGVALMGAAFLGTQAVIADGRTLSPVWVAARDLPTGAVLGAEDLEIARVRLPDGVSSGYLDASVAVEGNTLVRPVRAGELIPAHGVVAATTPGRTLTISVDPEHAVGGLLRPGDRVDVYATFGAEGAEAETVLIARGVEVVDLVADGGAVLGQSILGVTVTVTAEDVGPLTFASRVGDIDLVRVDGPPDASGRATTRAEDLR